MSVRMERAPGATARAERPNSRPAGTILSGNAPGRRGFGNIALRALALALACNAAAAHAQVPEAEALDTVIVTGTRLERALPDTPSGVTVIEESVIRDGRQGLQLDEALTRVPGLFLQNRYNFAQGQRLSLRGFGARAPFGVRGIRIRVDGFPETLPDGQSQVGSIDLDTATRAEVIRGPASVLYGNASGGVISVETANGRDHAGTAVRAQGGSDSFFKFNAHSGGEHGDWDYHAGISHLDFEGWRQQSAVEKTLFNSKIGWNLSDTHRLEAVVTALELPTGEDPGGLNLTDLAEDRRQASEDALLLDAGQEVAQQRIGLTHEWSVGARTAIVSRAFYTRRDFEQLLPFSFPGVDNNFITFDRDFYGVDSAFKSGTKLAALPLRYTLGVEAQRQLDDRRRRGGGPQATSAELIQNEEQEATVLAAFGQIDLDLHPTVTLNLGARIDRLELSIDDRLLSDGDDSGDRRFTEASYSGGLIWRYFGPHRLYAQLATAFESPTFTEFARPDGSAGFNPAIDPQEGLNREIGFRNGFGSRLHYDLTLFSVRVDDEITPFEIDGRTFFQNAARTDREGIEAALVWDAGHGLTLTGSYTYARLRFDRFIDRDGNDLSGNDLPGVPRQNAFLEAAWQGQRAFAAIDTQITDSRYAENANDLSVGGFALVNMRGGWRFPLGSTTLEIFAGINNLLDRDYIANLRVNANQGRPLDARGFFEPGPERQLYGGIALRL